MKDFKTATDGTGTTSATGKIHFLSTMLHGKSLRKMNILAGQVGSMANRHLKLIQYFSLINALNKKNAQWDAQCENLNISCLGDFPHDWQN